MSVFSAIFVFEENCTQSHSAKFLNWGDHVNSVPDLAASPPAEHQCKYEMQNTYLKIFFPFWTQISFSVISKVFFNYIRISFPEAWIPVWGDLRFTIILPETRDETREYVSSSTDDTNLRMDIGNKMATNRCQGSRWF